MRCPLQGNLQFLGRCPDWYALPRWGKWKRVAPLHEAVGDALGEGRLPCGSGGAGGVVWVGEVGAFDQHGGAVGAAAVAVEKGWWWWCQRHCVKASPSD